MWVFAFPTEMEWNGWMAYNVPQTVSCRICMGCQHRHCQLDRCVRTVLWSFCGIDYCILYVTAYIRHARTCRLDLTWLSDYEWFLVEKFPAMSSDTVHCQRNRWLSHTRGKNSVLRMIAYLQLILFDGNAWGCRWHCTIHWEVFPVADLICDNNSEENTTQRNNAKRK